jgi:NAD(P)-dependent dehydrogenase (short-subunit alcohol dehydrogenase family)
VLSSATWLVNGGRARPAGEPAVAVPDPLPVHLEDATMIDSTAPPPAANGNHPSAGEVLPVAAQPAYRPAVPGDRAADVIGRYQQVMQQFLDTQRSVMLAYLGRPDPVAAAAPAPAPAVVPACAPAPVPLASGNGEGPAKPLELTVARVPAAPAVPVVPRPAAVAPAALDADALRVRLLEVVSDRTGYPPDMLELDADLEADLGIDSIKRVEIAGTIVRELSLPDGIELDAEEMTSSRTLRQVLAVLERLGGPSAPGQVQPQAGGDERLPFVSVPVDERIGRHVLRPVDAPPASADGGLAAHGVVVIVDDSTGVGVALEARLSALGHRSIRLQGEDAVAAHEPAKALVHLGALGPGGVSAAELLSLAQQLRADLEAAAATGGAALIGATAFGGAFGVDGLPEAARAEDAAVCGFVKTLALEWRDVRVTAVDLDRADPETLAAQIAAELLAADGLVEVGYRNGRRTVLELLPEPVTDEPGAAPALDSDSVVLVTGGARGITAEAAVALAQRHCPTLLLVGRTAAGEADPELDGIDDGRELRRAVMARRSGAGETVTPAAVEDDVRRLTASREVRRTLERVRAAGAQVEYLRCDVADAQAFGGLIDDVYTRFGRLDGVIHGAGVIEDKLVRDKEPASLERVLAVKAGAARTLAARLRPDGLRFLFFFGSVSGRFGNRGQADYAAASEILNKLAQELDGRWPARVAAINWGPWGGTGMVSPEVQRQFEARGVPLIDVATGCSALLDELGVSAGDPEVVIGAAPPSAMLAADELTATGLGRLEVVRALDPDRDLYLADHCLDGKPVLPFAAAMELMAETAAAARPALQQGELSGIRLFKGVTVDGEIPHVRVVAESLPDNAVGVTIADAGTGRPCYRSVVRATVPAMSAPEPLEGLEPFPMTVADAYRDLLFHGPLFQGIEEIKGLDARGASTTLRGSTPADCVRDAGRARWLLDPVLVDAGLQMQVLWARLQWDVTLLPADIASARFLAGDLVGRPVLRHELRIRPESRPPLCLADHWFLTSDGRVVGVLTGVQGVGTRALNRLAEAAS